MLPDLVLSVYVMAELYTFIFLNSAPFSCCDSYGRSVQEKKKLVIVETVSTCRFPPFFVNGGFLFFSVNQIKIHFHMKVTAKKWKSWKPLRSKSF